MVFTAEEYSKRRQGLKTLMSGGSVLLLGNDEVGINFEDNVYPFRQDSTFLYFFGLQNMGLSALIDLDGDEDIIFGDEPSIDQIVFAGSTESLQSQALKVGVFKVKPSFALQESISGAKKIHYLPPYRAEHSLKLSALLNMPVGHLNEKSSIELIKGVVQLRSIKSDVELLEIEKALKITAKMQLKALEMAKVGGNEADVYGAISQIALAKGAGTSFPPIVTINGQTLHNHYRGNDLKEGEMLLCDCGAEVASGYAGDLTRTFPVSGTFTNEQKEVYDIVHHAYSAAVALLRPEQLFLNVHLKACKEIVRGLIRIGLMKGDPEKAVEQGAHTLFFQCGLGHMLGLDVHDMENLGEQYVGYTDDLKQRGDFGFRSLRMGRALKAGMVLTIEPGIYFIPELINLRRSEGQYTDFVNYDKLEAYKGFGGIRIEDVFCITGEGAKLLGSNLPTTSDEIEACIETGHWV